MNYKKVQKLLGTVDAEFNDYSIFDSTKIQPTPEHRLLVAVLARSIIDAIQPAVSSAKAQREGLRDEALRFFYDDEAEHPFSFNWIAEHLAADARVLRKKILELIHHQDLETIYRTYYRRYRFRDSGRMH